MAEHRKRKGGGERRRRRGTEHSKISLKKTGLDFYGITKEVIIKVQKSSKKFLVWRPTCKAKY